MNRFEIIDTWFTWLTPSVLFCIINLMIVTIFLLKPHEKLKKLTEAQQLIRVPLIFQRVLSNRSAYRSENQPVHHETFYHAPNQEPVREESNSEPVKKEIDPVHEETRTMAHAEPVDVGAKSHMRSKSEMVQKKAVKKVLRKSFSKNETERTTTSQGDVAVDEKADDFISKFRKALKLQRVDSVNLMYNEMMSRGT